MNYNTHKFDDVVRYKKPNVPRFANADGDQFEPDNEEYVEYENEELDPSLSDESFTAEESPKFRFLVRAKKLELKAQYGKAHFSSKQECKQVPYPGFKTETKQVPYPCIKDRRPATCYKSVNVQVPTTLYKEVCVPVPVWNWGWRKKWREFKQQGGLAQLRMQSKGMAPIPGYTAPVAQSETTSTTTGGTKKKGRKVEAKNNTSSSEYQMQSELFTPKVKKYLAASFIFIVILGVVIYKP